MKIAFDIGNVLAQVELGPSAEKLYELKHVKSSAEGLAFWESISPLVDIGVTDVDQELVRQFDIKPRQLKEFMEVWSKAVRPVHETTQLLVELHNQDHNIALLSNIGANHANLVRLHFPSIYNEFVQHFSCEVGAKKPSKLFFQSFLMEHPKFYKCIFVDDRLENVKAARLAGFDAVHFALDSYKDDKTAAEELRKIVLDSGN